MPSLLDRWGSLLCCPACRSPLRDGAAGGGVACEACLRDYPVTEGIVCCFDPGGSGDPESEIKRREVDARDEKAEGYESAISRLRNAIEIPPCVGAIQAAPSDVVAELGCGTGRLTLRYAARVGRVVAVDFSLQSLLVLRRKIPRELRDRVLLVQADVSALPLAAHAFSKVVSFQVIEHLPTPESGGPPSGGPGSCCARAGPSSARSTTGPGASRATRRAASGTTRAKKDFILRASTTTTLRRRSCAGCSRRRGCGWSCYGGSSSPSGGAPCCGPSSCR